MSDRERTHESTAQERRAYIAEILGVGLLRVKQRGSLVGVLSASPDDSRAMPLDSSASRLESSAKSGLTVQNG